MKSLVATLFAIPVGLLLCAMPFLWYGLGGGHSHAASPHSDHGARHGGHLLMLHDYHLEIVEHDASVELYMSDSSRRPLRPDACEVAFDGGPPVACKWRSHRFIVAKPIDAKSGLYQLRAGGTKPMQLKFP